jgi:Domain of Unknown Function with PDB structure (DUF3857)/Transglutaminase-like superfamily
LCGELRVKNPVKFVTAALSLALAICAFAVPAWSQEFQPIPADELKMTSEPLAPDAPAVILLRRVDRDDNGGNGRVHEDNYLRIKVLTEEGRKYADVEISFYPELENVRTIKARTVQPDGSVANFDGTIFEKYVVRARGVKVMARTFTLPNVQVGSIIEYFFTMDLRGNLFDSHWILSSDLFTLRAQFSLIPLKSSYVPMHLHWSWTKIPSGFAPREGPDHAIRMDVTNIPAFQAEDFTPPENELKSRVDFVYQSGTAESDPEIFWKRTAKAWNDYLELFLKKHKAVDEAAGRMFAPSDPPEEKLRKIYARVQSLRNTSYEIERTEKEQQRDRDKEKPAENVDDVWKHGYGDSVQLTWLFLALARSSGFEAYGCWVASRSRYFFDPKLMEAEGLSVNVVLVKLGGKELYLDPGSLFASFGLLPWNETFTQGIRLDNNGGTWIRTPLPESADSQISRTARFQLSESGTLEGNLSVTFTGLQAMYERLEARNADAAARKQHLEDLVKGQVPVPAEVDLIKGPDWNSSESPLRAEFTVKISNWASSTGRRFLMPVGIFAGYEKSAFESAKRIHPVYFAYPYGTVDDLTVELPPGWQVTAVPQAARRKGNSIIYNTNVEQNSGTLHITRELNIDIFLLQPSEYFGLRSFFQLVRSSDEQQIILQPPAAHDQTGGAARSAGLTMLPAAS